MVRAQNDLYMVVDNLAAERNPMQDNTLEALESGALSEETIDTACRRVLTWKQNLGLL